MKIAQGDVWQINFAEGFERPGVVVTRNELNAGRLILIVPCTSSRVHERARHRNNVPIESGMAGLTSTSVAQVHLIQPVDRDWFLRKRGTIGDEKLSEILQALAWAVDLFPV